MTVIHTTDDLIHLLNENDEFRQAVRRHVLSDELLQLPERFAKFETRVESFIDEQRQFNDEQRQFNDEQRQINDEQRRINKRVDRRLDSIDKTLEELRQFNEDQRQFNKDQRQFNEDQRQFNKDQRQFNKRMETAIGELRGKVARQVVGAHFLEIAADMGFRFKGLLMRRDLGQLIFDRDLAEIADIPQNDQRSFVRADLVIEVTDSAGAIHYIAVEASYTADQRDTSRAQRNAALLTRFTGHPAHAAIASVRNVHEIQPLIDNGTVYWYTLAPSDFTPE